ncbi:hypothetical protein EHQ23_00005 [Leptospira bourretii]|uniref:Lipoprotein n=1 Tax=Leptospira bourretii TaxID=2484962 RepID=A0A4R9ITT4_9LEPT|nr:hypothetical protein [Leptospira bourretii]TGK92187.1 hypothetical protein EHQ23_00005 [Leptospira bourretii]TGK94963.1 hypothetical protein EHQ26_00095 [Leptospira bourretii]TGL29873.1 hypothetical protein EHQ45_14510 [Leptospira bourretii]
MKITFTFILAFSIILLTSCSPEKPPTDNDLRSSFKIVHTKLVNQIQKEQSIEPLLRLPRRIDSFNCEVKGTITIVSYSFSNKKILEACFLLDEVLMTLNEKNRSELSEIDYIFYSLKLSDGKTMAIYFYYNPEKKQWELNSLNRVTDETMGYSFQKLSQPFG